MSKLPEWNKLTNEIGSWNDFSIVRGKEFIKASLPIIIAGQKGLVEESDLIIPNMRGIMSARTKPLITVNTNGTPEKSESIKFEKPATKQECKMIDSDKAKELVTLLHNEAKVI